MKTNGRKPGPSPARGPAESAGSLPGTGVERWNDWFEQLESFVRRHGHTRVGNAGKKFKKLARWLHNQCSLARRNLLAPERRERLESLKVEFRLQAAGWNEGFEQLESFVLSHGHCRVALAGKKFKKLTSWLNNQCTMARRNLLAPERRERLERLKVEFYIQKHRWEERFTALAEFKARHGHLQVPRETPELLELGTWLYHQTTAFNRGTLSAERVERLRQLGWKPEPRRPRRRRSRVRRWNDERMFAALESFKKRFGHCRVPDDWAQNRRLGAWLSYTRYLGRRESLPAELRDRLLHLGVAFGDTILQRWERRFAALEDYVKRFGNYRVPWKWPENPDLAQWVRVMWRHGREGKLAADRYQRLAALGVSFDEDWPKGNTEARRKRDEEWDESFRLLEEFKARFGHCRIPYTWPENQVLATWLTRQLRAGRGGQLRPDLQERLRSLGVAFESPRGSGMFPSQLRQQQQNQQAA